MSKPTEKKPVLFIRTLALSKTRVLFAVLILMLLTSVISITRVGVQPVQAAAPATLNFQARLLNNTGSLVSDGYYNVEFKLYNASSSSGSSQGSCTGDANCLWTETRTSGNKVQVKNGYLSAYLGDITALPSNIWNQQLWLTMNVGGDGSPSWDGEMTPRIRLTSVPYAFRATVANSAETLSKNTGSFTGTVDFSTLTADRTFLFPDTSLATTGSPGTICVYNGSSSNCPAASGSTFYLWNDTTLQTAANFNLQARDSGVNGTIAGILRGAAAGQTVDLLQFQASNGTVLAAVTATGNLQVASSVDTRAAGALNVGTTTATSVNISKAGATTTINGAVTVNEAATFNDNVTIAASKTLRITGNNTAGRPVSPAEGTLYFDTDTKQLLIYANGKWQGDRSTATKIVAASNSSQAVKDAADYVADGTGDQTEINDALTAAAGGKVYLTEGTYTINAGITIPNNTTLAGAGAGTVITIPNSFNTNIKAISNYDTSTPTGISVQDLTLDGNKANQTSGTDYGIYFGISSGGPGENVKITGVNAAHWRDDGFLVTQFNGVTISSSQAQDSNRGYVLIDGVDMMLTNSIAKDNYGSGFLVVSSSGEHAQATLSGNTANNNYDGFTVAGDDTQVTMTGNVATANDEHGFYLSSAGVSGTFDGNIAKSNGVSGFYINGATDSTLSNNTATDNDDDGFYIVGTAGLTVVGNTSSGNVGSGFNTTGGRVTTTGNTALNNDEYGFSFTSVYSSTISGNVASGNSSGGFYIYGGSTYNVISGNRAFDNGGATTNNGIVLDAGAQYNSVTSNVITDTSATTTNYAITVINGSSNVYLANNTFNTGTIYVANGSSVIYGGQVNDSGNYLVQPAGTIELMKDTNITGNLAVSGTSTFSGLATFDGNLRITDGSSNYATIDVQALAGNYTISIPTVTANDTFCLESLGNCAANGTNFIQNQNASAQTSANLWIDGTARADTSVLTPLLDTGTATVLNIGTTNATQINLSKNVVVAASQSLTITGGNTASRPGSPTEGMLYYDTTTHQLLQYNGTKWVSDRSSHTKIVAPNGASQAIKDSADYVANGTTDQTVINSALTAAAGGTVLLLPGTYTATGTILIPNNTTLTGSGANNTVVRLNVGSGSDNLIENSNTSTGAGVSIRDVTLDGSLGTGGTQNGIYLTGMVFLTGGGTATNLGMSGWAHGNALSMANGGYLYTFAHNVVDGNITINDSIITNVTANAIQGDVTLTNGGEIADFTGNYAYGALSLNASHIITASGNSITGITTLANSAYIDAFTGNVTCEISITDTDGYPATISSNTIYACDGTLDAISLTNADNMHITGNTIISAGASGYAIDISSSTAGAYLADNTLDGLTIRDQSTTTRYGGQNNGTSYLIQPAQNITIGSASTTTTIQGNTAVTLSGTTGTTMVCQNASNYLSTCDASILAPTATNFIRNGTSQQTSANFNIQAASGVAGTITGTSAGSSTALVVNTGAASNVGLIVKGAASQTADLVQVQDNSGNVILHVTTGGAIGSGDQTGASTNSTSTTLTSGNVSGATSNSGNVAVKSGNSTTSGNTGTVTIGSGNATSGNSGDVNIETGSASGTKGTINIGTGGSAVAIGSGNAISITTGGTISLSTTNLNSNTNTSLNKTYTAGTGGVTQYDVVILGNDGGNMRVLDTTTARDIRVAGVATTTASSGNLVSVAQMGTITVNVDTAAVAIGDQLVASTTSGRATVDNNATKGIIGIAMTSKAGGSNGTVVVSLGVVRGQTNPQFTGNVDIQGNNTIGGTLGVTGLTTLSGGLTVTNAGNVAFQRGTDYTATGSQTDVNFGTGALFRVTSASAVTINSIAGGADGRIITLFNASSNVVTLLNDDGATGTASMRIITGTGGNLAVPAGATVQLTYDGGASRWRVVGGSVMGSVGATTALSNLSSVAINASLTPNADNTLDLGSASYSWRTLYADTSVLSPLFDTPTAAALNIGTTNATAINLNKNVVVAANQSLRLVGGNTASRPGSPTEGMLYFDTDTHQLLQYNGTKWVSDRTEAVIVAANNSSQADKDAADYVADGNGGGANDGDQVQINAALTAAAGKKVILLAGTYTADATILIPNNTTLAGVGYGTVVQLADLDATDNLIENSDTSTGTGITIQDMKLDGQDTLNTAGTQYGVYLNNMGDYSAGRTGSTIRNVRIDNFRSAGIFYWSSDNNTLTGSTINGMDTGGATLGVYFDSSPRNNIISNNIFLSNTYAIRADGSGSTNNAFTDNTFRSNSYGIMLYGATNTTISGNNFDATTNHSVDLYNDTAVSTYNEVIGNSFRGDGVAVAIDNTSDNVVSGNKIHDDGSTTNNNAITVNNNADRNSITSNAITDSSCSVNCYAISITSASADATYLANNTIGTNGTINNAGTGTIYAGQTNGTAYLLQPTTDITIGSASTTTTIQGNTAVTLSGTTGTTMVCQNGSGYLSSCDASILAPTATNFIRNQNASQQTSANYWISGVARADTSVLTPLLDTATAAVLNVGTTNATGINLNKNTTIASGQNLTVTSGTTSLTGTTNINTTGSATTTIGNSGATNAIAGTTSITGNTSINTTGSGTTTIGSVSGGAVSITANAASSFTTNTGTLTLQGAGGISLNSATTVAGNLTVTNAGNVAFQRNTTNISTTGTLTDLNIGTGALFRFTGASTQTISSITNGADGRIITLVNAASQAMVIQNDTGGTAANRIITGTGSNISVPAGATVTLIYDSATSRWRVIGETATAGGAANQQLSNLSGTVAVNLALNPGNDNTLDLGSSANSWRTLYSDTSVLTPLVDTASATALNVGTATANAVNISRTGMTTTVNGALTVAQVSRLNGNVGINIGAATPSWDLSFGGDAARSIRMENRTTAGAGYGLTVAAGGGNGSNTGGILTLQGGAAGGGNTNGGGVVIAGGAGAGSGVMGLVGLSPTAFTAVGSTQTFASSGSLTSGLVDAYSTIPINSTGTGVVVTIPSPATGNQIVGRVLYVTAVGGTNDFGILLSGTSINIAMKANSTATLIWNGTGWTAAGASSSTDLQSAYNNTLTSAGGAELVLNAPGGAADGLTIRNNGATPIVGGLLEVQTSIGSNLLSVNNNATEYAVNGGAETATNFATNWTNTTGGTVTQYTTPGNYVATGIGSVSVVTGATANHGAKNVLSAPLTSGMTYSVSMAVRGTTNFSTLQILYSPDGTTSGTTQCATAQTVTTGGWSRILCTFTAAGTINSSNAILIRQTDAVAHTFYIDNLSVTVNANMTFAADGNVSASLGSNWGTYNGAAPASQSSNIYEGAYAVSVAVTAATQGVRNNMAVTPAINTQYLVTFYAKASSGTPTIAAGFLPAGGNGAPSSPQQCVDYNTQAIGTSNWTRITCVVTTPGSGISDPDLVIYQTSSGSRTLYIDALTINLNNNNSNNVQIGGANTGGPTTLLTLDRASTPPIAANNDAYLGSMYYDTTTGRIQCYEADGWGACGSSPDNIITLTPEYSGAVLNGSGVGTMTADFCSNESGVLTVGILCSNHEARNFYRWTSPQATSQTYSIYVTYKLPTTFKSFNDSNTIKLTALTDSTTNASASIQVFRKRGDGSAISSCGSATTINSTNNVWQQTEFAGDETNCGFVGGDYVVFRINMTSKSNANVYVENLDFIFTNS